MAASVRDLREVREEAATEILSRGGRRVRIILEGPAPADWCGFDPQNTVPLTGGRILHFRWLRVCRGGFTAEVRGGVIEEERGRVWLLGLEEGDRLSVEDGGGAPLALGEGSPELSEGRLVSEALRLTGYGLRIEAWEEEVTVRIGG